MLALSGEAALGNVKTTGPVSPKGASCTCALSGDGTLCVHWIASEVAVSFRSAEQDAVAVVSFGGTTCAPFALNATMSTVRGRIWPRISPDGRPAVWTLT